MYSVTLVLCVLGSLLTLSAGDSYDTRRYPNPWINPTPCGSKYRSYICDPNRILSDNDASQLDVKLHSVVSDTKCPCATYTCSSQRNDGYKIGIAVMKSFSDDAQFYDQNTQLQREQSREQMQVILDKARQIAFDIRKNWNMGICDEDVIILYSRDDDVVFTVTGAVARMKLTDKLVADISLEARRRNYDKFAFSGLDFMISKYLEVFLDRYRDVPRPPSAVTGEASTMVCASLSLTVIVTAISTIKAVLIN